MAQVRKDNKVNAEIFQSVLTGMAQAGVHVLKDLTVGNLIKPWSGESSDCSDEDLLSNVDKAVALGGWSGADKVKIIGVRLEEAVAAFRSSNATLRSLLGTSFIEPLQHAVTVREIERESKN